MTEIKVVPFSIHKTVAAESNWSWKT